MFLPYHGFSSALTARCKELASLRDVTSFEFQLLHQRFELLGRMSAQPIGK
ncbi:MAG: hypothetical protein MUC83_01310 [Pirellula sp.]|nr:hypothetical protein [Pirellula sp.]